MVKIDVYNQEGKKQETLELLEEVFGLGINTALVKQVYTTLSANVRSGHSHTKDRGERSGSGRKPWKQKGTGRARTGSVRNPIWRKGGVTFGPLKDRNTSLSVNDKMKKKALCVVMSEKIRQGNVKVVDSLIFSEVKTKHAVEILHKVGVSGKILVALGKEDFETKRALNNIPNLEVKLFNDINVVDVLHSRTFLTSKASLQGMETRLK
jgi:large subunit ribosomal protein L4